MYKLIVFIPDEAKERVKHALFNAGAGSLGAYSHCSWECLGTGQ
ncbi:MAG: NGG1p interacting factor NIF3, partial [Gammaproteobacteria bacterium]|nr:NGG1p interacting factor NIF3 [Gammaproteobacteria bacterium]